ncbi:TetR/AcrR family transcriptional regulator [Paenibacillus hamazuiensis]|uniref:TetR/AcrR family transcriptional regulator n=1 Tax=Paenibacillus hamazuiensis TaxID=2936508 RepID=UPI00200BC2AB|nr:TetR/AcrR family transcriptional regulator [Paenibacillus hamazuiensis]
MGEEKRDRLIAAALKLLEVQGYHNTKVSDIVQEAGVAQGTFYLYFKSKEDLFRSIAESCLGEIVSMLEREDADPCEDDGMYRMITDILKVYAHNRSIIRIISKHGNASNELHDIMDHFYFRLMTSIKNKLIRFNVYPDFTDEELEIAAYAKIGKVEAVAYQWFIIKDRGLDEVDKIARVIVDLQPDCLPPKGGESP